MDENYAGDDQSLANALAGYVAQGPTSIRQAPANYNTALAPIDELAFRGWLKDNAVPFNPQAPQSDYDMRGFWQGLQQQNPRAVSSIDPNDQRLHYPDFWKTPLHRTFSNESQWASPMAPQWTPDDKLAAPSGRVLFDDRAPDAGSFAELLRSLTRR